MCLTTDLRKTFVDGGSKKCAQLSRWLSPPLVRRLSLGDVATCVVQFQLPAGLSSQPIPFTSLAETMARKDGREIEFTSYVMINFAWLLRCHCVHGDDDCKRGNQGITTIQTNFCKRRLPEQTATAAF